MWEVCVERPFSSKVAHVGICTWLSGAQEFQMLISQVRQGCVYWIGIRYESIVERIQRGRKMSEYA